ncbi:hypothetical protein CKA32_006547 [Geitlerinema sp. FC II]|nr:hypothetical protein [Geitlerinema sp. CS-897]PPT10087.1 hypothetical protein CKA32_006547 [Geitlerinema sp. FC II]
MTQPPLLPDTPPRTLHRVLLALVLVGCAAVDSGVFSLERSPHLNLAPQLKQDIIAEERDRSQLAGLKLDLSCRARPIDRQMPLGCVRSGGKL